MANKQTPQPKLSLIEQMAKLPPKKVSNMVEALNANYAERWLYELGKRPNASHTWLRRAAWVRNNESFARFMLALNADPANLLNRERIAGARSDLKGLDKIKALYRYTTGKTNKLGKLEAALFALTIIAANKGYAWISNAQLELVLSTLDITSLSDEVAGPLEAWRNLSIDPMNARQEACRWRTSFENLNCYSIETAKDQQTSQAGVVIDLANPLIDALNERWQLAY